MTNKKVAILQSNYIPWKGYFDIINSVDEFVIYDDVQYTKNDWRNRNKIKTPQGLQWLTIPVDSKGRISEDLKINEIRVLNKAWSKKHFNALVCNYSKAPYFKEYKDLFEQLYKSCEDEELLCNINYKFIKVINEILGIDTKISYSTDYKLPQGQTQRLVSLCKQLGATEYISGPAAKNYLQEDLFSDENIQITWFDYSGYKEYNQLYPPFEHNASVLDLIFNLGTDARNYMKEAK